jgi:hypothetical protein
MYLFNGAKFIPQRMEREQITASGGSVYKARYGAWDGTRIGSAFLPNQPVHRWWGDVLISLRPWDPTTGRYSTTARMDTLTASAGLHRPELVRWDAERGEVRCGSTPGHWVGDVWTEDFYRPVTYPVGIAATQWFVVGTTNAPEVVPVYTSTAGAPADSANAPISFVIDPTVGATQAPALIDPYSIKVKAVITTANDRFERELRPTSNYEQGSIRGDEFCPRVVRSWTDTNLDHIQDPAERNDGTKAEIRFSRWDPPRPTSLTLFPGVTGILTFELQVSWYARRNYVYDAARDAAGNDPFVTDVVVADYSSRSVQSITLSLQKYMDLEPDETLPSLFRLPTDETPNEVTVREQLNLRNFGR